MFAAGDLVICVDASPSLGHTEDKLVLGTIYTIHSIGHGAYCSVRHDLVGLGCFVDYCEMCKVSHDLLWRPERFRKIAPAKRLEDVDMEVSV